MTKRRGIMPTSRLEAFSDGVLAIIITIMVLELRAPHPGFAPASAATLTQRDVAVALRTGGLSALARE